MDVTKPHNFIWFGARDVTKPYKFIRFGASLVPDGPPPLGGCRPAGGAAPQLGGLGGQETPSMRWGSWLPGVEAMEVTEVMGAVKNMAKRTAPLLRLQQPAARA